jgi:hypothetical protein
MNRWFDGFPEVHGDPPSLKLWRGKQHWSRKFSGLDVGGPSVEAFGMISESCPALIVAGREVT